MLDRGAEIERAKEDGATLLWISCANGHANSARLLWERGARIHRANKKGETPLYAACAGGHLQATQLLLVLGAEVNRARTDGATPLHIACEKGHVEVVRLLLERGTVFEHDSSALCEGDAVEAKYRGRRYYPGKVSRDHGNGRYDIAYDDGEEEDNVEARLIRKLPLSPLAIAKENGHAAVVALLEESSRG